MPHNPPRADDALLLIRHVRMTGEKMVALACVLMFGIASGTLQSAIPAKAPAAGLTPEELQIVVAALDVTGIREARRLAGGRRRGATLAVVSDATLAVCEAAGTTSDCIRESTQVAIERLLGGSDVPIARTFASRNGASSAVPEFGERIVVIPAKELSGMFGGREGWEAFNRRFGETALVQFSAPAIDGDRAAVYVVFGCGGLCGKSWLVTLERSGQQFRVRKSQLLSVS